MNIPELYKLYANRYLVDTDSRKIQKGAIYFALKGANFNGNHFALDALKNGASFAIIDEKEFSKHPNMILVKDVLETLQQLANYHRVKLNAPIIALTGSNGKTTTKELIKSVLSEKFNTTYTLGNLNNHIGVPLTLLRMTPNTQFGVVEMGANHPKEIAFLCSIANPNYGYITNFGKAHLEGFGSIEGVIKAKSELYNYLRKTGGKVILNAEDTVQKRQSKGIASIIFDNSTIQFKNASPFVQVLFDKTTIKSQLIGKYNFTNIAAAISIGNYFEIPTDTIKNAIENYVPNSNRSQIIIKGSNKIILDAYNANPSSMKEALENFNSLKDQIKVVFLGDMFELGTASTDEHQKIAELATSYNFKGVHLIGKVFSSTIVNNALMYTNFNTLKKEVQFADIQHATILIKGSRGMSLERILDFL